MISNTYSILLLFIAILTGVLALFLGPSAFRIYQGWGSNISGEQRINLENRSYLLLLIAVVILSIKLISWPFFYVTLQSFIPNVHGAMCIFGVSQVHPLLSSVAQILKPMLFLLIGYWLLLNRLDRTTETSPLFSRKFLILSIISLMVLADSGVDFAYFTNFQLERDVACCTSFFDLPTRSTATLPMSLLGQDYERYLLPLYYLSGISLLSFLVLCYARLLCGGFYEGSNKTTFLVSLSIGFILSVLNAVITVYALFEVIAPRVMALPNHHCIYCMWQYAPHSILLTALFLVGTMAPIWAFLLYTTGRHEETIQSLKLYVKNLYAVGIVGIFLSMGWVSIDLLVKG